jgi:hypothetical protein
MEPGPHVWPLDPRIVPFAVTVTKYHLRRQIIEIGAGLAKTEWRAGGLEFAVPADGVLSSIPVSLISGGSWPVDVSTSPRSPWLLI